MAVTSFYFLIFCAVLLAVYYTIPGGLRLYVLLLAGGCFVFAGGGWTSVLLIVSQCLAVWLVTLGISAAKGKARSLLMFLNLLICLSSLVILKYIGVPGLAAPIGISYYSMTLISMSADVYFETAEPVRDPARSLLTASFFPALTSGPILSFRKDASALMVYGGDLPGADFENVSRGLQRMLWGLMKKLVISERLALIVDPVYSDPSGWGWGYLILGTFCFSFQLYTDFSGCMDIILGLSEALGIKLPENFNRPFLSRTVAEYWRRWHITLGAFMRDYLFYPVLRTRLFSKLGAKFRSLFGKKTGKTATTAAAMLILWTAVGFWHGGDIKYVIGSGLLHWFYITTGEILNPKFNKFWSRFSFGADAPLLNALRVVRTFCLVSLGFVFFRAESAGSALGILSRIFTGASGSLPVSELGISLKDTAVLLMFLAVMIVIEAAADRCPGGDIRKKIASFRLTARWVIWFALIFAVIIFGKYGPGYDQAAFIYQEF